jgi:formate dehydrogenase subunit gamma
MNDIVRMKGDPRVPGALIERNTPWMRVNHWLLAGFFLLAAFSGLSLFHPALFWLTALFGGGPWTRILHPFMGLLMLLFFLLFAPTVWQHMFMMARDWTWLSRIGDVVKAREDRLPEVGKYNAGQKLVFWAALACLLALPLTGIPMWRAYFSQLFPVGLIRGASVIHAIAALVLVCTIIVHIDSAIWVRGTIRAMTRGWVTPGWAWKHHRAWYREILTHHATSSRPRSD